MTSEDFINLDPCVHANYMKMAFAEAEKASEEGSVYG